MKQHTINIQYVVTQPIGEDDEYTVEVRSYDVTGTIPELVKALKQAHANAAAACVHPNGWTKDEKYACKVYFEVWTELNGLEPVPEADINVLLDDEDAPF